MTRLARWFLDIALDSSTLRWWSGSGDVTLDGNTYTGLGTRWKAPERLKRKANLKSEKLELDFDSSRQTDNSDPIGALLDEKWRRRAVRLRRIAWDVGDDPDDGDVLEDERGRIRNLSDKLKAGRAATITMEIESGALAYLERRKESRTPASQQAVFAGDKGFDLIAQLEGVTLPWRTKHTKVGTVQVELADEYEPHPREWVVGRFAKTGSFVAAFTNGQQRKYMQRVYAIADHRINKLDKVWINGYLARNSALTHGTRTLVYLEGNSEQRCWVTFYDGRDDQTADSYLVSAASEWTSAHRLRGVAYVIVEHLWDSDLPESFDYRFGGEGAFLYDRRKDTTAGGSGSHRWDDPDTWEYSTNAMVAIDHYRSGVRVMSGSEAMWFGVGESPDAVPYAEFEELANHCDDNITLKAGGTQKRYEVNGTISAGDDHAKNLEKLAAQMAARAIDLGGRLSIRPPVERTSVITLTDDDVVRDSESQADPGAGLDDMVNTINGQFINPANDYKSDDFPEVQISDYVDDDNGEIEDTLDLDLEISAERAQRLAKLTIEDSRRVFELEETYGPDARVIVPGEWFTRESDLRGFPSGKTFEAEEVERFLDGSIRVKAREVYPDQLVWDESTAVDLSEPPAFPQVNLDAIEPPSISGTPFTYSAAGVKFPGVQIDLDYGANQIDAQTEIEVARDDGTGEPDGSFEILSDIIAAGTTAFWIASNLLPGVDYVVRARGILGERVGDWTDWEQFTAPENFVSKSTLEAEPGSTLATQLTAIQVVADDAAAAVVSEAAARAAADSAASSDRTAIRAEFAAADTTVATNAAALVTDEASARASAIAAEAASRELLEAYVAGPSPNLVPNSNFELDDEGWTLVYGSAVNNVNGTYWNATAPASGTTVMGYSPFFEMVDTGSYSFSYEQSPSIAGSGKIRCDLECWDASTRLSREGLVASSDGSWTRIKSEGISSIPSGTVKGRLRWYFNSADSGDQLRIRRVKVERNATATAYTSEQGEYERGATVLVYGSAIADIEGNLSAKYGIEVDGGGNGAFVSLADGTTEPSSIILDADKITLDGDVFVTGSITGPDMFSLNALSNTQITQSASSTALTSGAWVTVASLSFTSEGIGVKLRGSCDVEVAGFEPGGPSQNIDWRLRRGSTVLKSGTVVGQNVRTTPGGVGYNTVTGQVVADYNDLPSAGAYTYTLQVYVTNGSASTPTQGASNRYLEAEERYR